MASARVYISDKQREISFPDRAVRLGLFSLRNDPTAYASKITLIFNSVKKAVLVSQNADVFADIDRTRLVL